MPAAESIRLRRGTPEDIPFVMSTERLEGYGDVVGRWDEARHRAALSDGRHVYFIASDDAGPVGFVIVRDWGSAEQVALVKRIAVSRPGQGQGRAILRELVGIVFAETNAYRLCLGVFPENLRARRAYEAVGFVAEGVARGTAYFGGVNRDELIMSILRPEWMAQNASETSRRLASSPTVT